MNICFQKTNYIQFFCEKMTFSKTYIGSYDQCLRALSYDYIQSL